MKERKITLYLCIVLCLSAAVSSVLSLAYKIPKEAVKQIQLDENVCYQDTDYFYSVDPIQKENGILVIRAWAANKEQDVNYVKRQVLLRDPNQQIYALPTVAEERGLTDLLNTGYNYDKGGVRAQCKLAKLTPDVTYDVALLVTEQDGSQFYLDLNTEVTNDGKEA